MVDEGSVGWVINGLDPSDFFDEARIMPVDVLQQLGLCIRGSSDQNGMSIQDRGCNFVQERLIFGRMAAAYGVRLVVDVARRVMRMENQPFNVVLVEVKYARFEVINPHNRMLHRRHGGNLRGLH